MEDHERNLFIALCLGLRLKGSESVQQLRDILEEVSAVSGSVKVQPLQDDLADWLDTSIARCQSQQAASVRLWTKIDEAGYSLVDVPKKLRRRVFGGSTNIQKRHAGNTLFRKIVRTAIAFVVKLVVVFAAVAAAWLAWREFGK